MISGRIIQFDRTRGYGFITPDSGGDDVFVHESELDGYDGKLSTGMRVEFDVIDGGRGPKAYAVRVLPDTGASPAVITRTAAREGSDEDGDDLCTVLSEGEFKRAATEAIIANSPQTPGGQIGAIRDALCAMARRYGWVD